MKLRKENVLIVDDDYDMLELLQRNLKAQNYHTYKASSVTEAIELLKCTEVDLMVTDLQMPGINGLELVRYVQEHFPQIPKLVITGYPSVDSAVRSVRSGALDYLVKPFTNEEFRKAVENSIASSELRTGTVLKSELPAKQVTHYAGMVGQSASFKNLIEVIERVRNNRATILIEGESGTGKELVARAIHYNGAFAAKPFIAVNCGAIPENLLESELFGHVKGAFTGATDTREGLFLAADGGTIFLDEIGNASQNVQSRLLRVLQEREVSMVGSSKTRKIQLRIIAATNSDLLAMVQNGLFRQDLYYRLNVVNILTPPLRDRKADIRPIIDVLLKKYGYEYNKPGIAISEAALDLLLRHSWPGNVRELENVIQRLIIMGDHTIQLTDLPDYLKYNIAAATETLQPLREVEKAYILKVLASVGDNKTAAAEILQIDRKTLRHKLNPPPDP